MITPIERKRLEVSIKAMDAAKGELELKILERLDEIERMKAHIAVQEQAILKAQEQLGG